MLTALQLRMGRGAQVIDDFGNCLDARSAQTAALAAQRLLSGRTVFFATQSPELARFLQPDWLIWITEAGASDLQSLLTHRRYHLVPNPQLLGNRRPTVSLKFDLSPVDKEPPPNFDRSVRGGGVVMMPGPLTQVTASVVCDDATAFVSQCTQLAFSGSVQKEFVSLPVRTIDDQLRGWRLGVIIGPSGSGKSVTLRKLPRLLLPPLPAPVWSNRAVIDVLGGNSDARTRARAAGLVNSQWTRRYAELSAGEQSAARLAYALMPFDEDTSCVVAVDEAFSFHDKESAKVSARKLHSYLFLRGRRTQLVLAGAAIDETLIAELQPEWIFNPSKPGSSDALRVFTAPPRDRSADFVMAPASVPEPGELFRRFAFRGTIRRVDHADWRKAWDSFKRHHYKSAEFPKDATGNMFILRCDTTHEPVAFIAYGSHCGMRSSTDLRKLFQERRLVVLPLWQGMRIGPNLSEALAAHLVADGKTRYRSVTGA